MRKLFTNFSRDVNKRSAKVRKRENLQSKLNGREKLTINTMDEVDVCLVVTWVYVCMILYHTVPVCNGNVPVRAPTGSRGSLESTGREACIIVNITMEIIADGAIRRAWRA